MSRGRVREVHHPRGGGTLAKQGRLLICAVKRLEQINSLAGEDTIGVQDAGHEDAVVIDAGNGRRNHVELFARFHVPHSVDLDHVEVVVVQGAAGLEEHVRVKAPV